VAGKSCVPHCQTEPYELKQPNRLLTRIINILCGGATIGHWTFEAFILLLSPMLLFFMPYFLLRFLLLSVLLFFLSVFSRFLSVLLFSAFHRFSYYYYFSLRINKIKKYI